MKSRNISVSIESLLVMVLLVIFAAAMSILIMRGSESYERLLSNKINEENARIALSYVNMMVRQNDRDGGIEYRENAVEGIDAIFVDQSDGDLALGTYIYYHDGYLRACYTDTIPMINLSEEVVEVRDFKYELDEDMITLAVAYEEDDRLQELLRYIHIRTADGM